MSAIHKRLHYAQRTEFKILKEFLVSFYHNNILIKYKELQKMYLKKTSMIVLV